MKDRNCYRVGVARRESKRPSFGQVKEFTATPSRIEVSAAGGLGYEYRVNRVVLPGPEGDLLDMIERVRTWILELWR